MDSRKLVNNLRVGPRKGESHTSASAEVCPVYTEGASIARVEEKKNTNDLCLNTDNDTLNDLMLTTSDGEEGRGGSRSETPATFENASSFFRKPTARGTTDESGNETAVSQDMEKMRRRFRKRRGSNVEEEEVSDKEKGRSTPKCTKRGRGRPLTTGECVSSAKALRDKATVEHEVMTETECETIKTKRRHMPRRSTQMVRPHTYLDETMSEDEDVTSAKLGAEISAGLEVITNVAKKSNNLSGPFVKALKDAASAIREASAALISRSTSAETRALEMANTRLTKELADMKAELAALKREVDSVRPKTRTAAVAPAAEATSPSSIEEMLQRAVREAVSLSNARLDARLEGLEARLLPEKRLRPPLAADRKKVAAKDPQPSGSNAEKGVPELDPTVSTLMPPLNPGPAQKGKKKKSAAAAEDAVARYTATTKAAHPGPSPDGEWTRVVKKNKKVQEKGEEKKKVPKRNRRKKSGRLRAPKTAAVVITLQPSAVERGVSYRDVLDKAKKKLDMAALDIPAVRFKLAVTGARMYEVSGESCKEKADALAGKLRDIIGDEDVRISRPQKCVEIRVSGLDDSATPTEIAEALARPSGCTAAEIKVGEIRRDRRGCGTAWVKCPVEAANKVTAPDTKVYVGWTVVRIELLDARPMRCYRCLEIGHTRATCTSECDRSGLCFRCGQSGHTISWCKNAPHCALCAARNLRADHSVGSKTCGGPTVKGGQGSRKSKAPQTDTPSTAVLGAGAAPMEAQ